MAELSVHDIAGSAKQIRVLFLAQKLQLMLSAFLAFLLGLSAAGALCNTERDPEELYAKFHESEQQ